MALRLATVPPAVPFADTVARLWFEAAGRDPLGNGDGLLLVPTRRFARTLGEAFLRVADGAALLLPRIEAIGAPDETGVALDAGFDLPPAIDPVQRIAALASLILGRGGRDGAPTEADRAWVLAGELARLVDEADREGITLADALARLVPAELAGHWQVTLDFLTVVTREWPRRLEALGMFDPARRHAAMLRAQARAWTDAPPAGRVWLAGRLAPTPPLAALVRAIARLPAGLVLLPGLDLALDEADWAALEPTHPQWGFRRLLEAVDATRGDVRPLAADPPADAPSTREAVFRRAMLPAPALARAWGAPPPAADGLFVLPAPDQQAEAVAIAMALRDAVETPGRRAALVTPDRGLAARVAAELGRFGIVADDSAGENLAETPQAVLLRLLARAAVEEFPPVTLLAVLKHPLAAWGLAPAEARAFARRLERGALRGPRRRDGLAGLRTALGGRGSDLAPFLDRLDDAFAPLLAHLGARRVAPATLFEALLETAERCAGDAVWAAEEGDALAARLAAVTEALALLPAGAPGRLPALLDATLAGVTVHGRRALRGRDALEIHPRVAIWGLIEARGQSADLVVLGGLTEGTWPAPAEAGPWMGRHMRDAVGFAPADAAIGEAAHDVVALACAAPVAILAWPVRRDHAPAVPSRWVARLEASRMGGAALPTHPAAAWAAGLDRPAGPPRPAREPRPCPPVHVRPRRLGVTEIETWLTDPYAIHARHILRLPELAAIDEEADHALFGTVVHAGLQRAFESGALDAAGIAAALHAALDREPVRPAVAAWWRPRLDRIAAWVAATEADRRKAGPPRALATEIKGEVVLEGPAGPFTLRGRADRIEIRPDGRLAVLDYKTGTPPAVRQVKEGWAPQLPLEAAMAAQGAFGPAFREVPAGELAHWKLSGGAEEGEIHALDAPDLVEEVVADAWATLEALVEAYDDPATPYLVQPRAGHRPRFAPYATLARLAEWGGPAGGPEEDEA